MDNKKKIIVAAVGLLAAAILVFVLGGNIFASDPNEEAAVVGFDFDAPQVEQKLLEASTKKEMYDENSEFDSEKYDSLAGNLSFLQKMKKKFDPREQEVAAPAKKESNIDDELQMLMAMQNAPVAQQGYAPVPTSLPVEAPVEVRTIPKEGSYFFGASEKPKSNAENLIPAETIDQGLLKQGSTIAIRTKEPIVLKSQNITIPQGAVIYGVVQFQENRLTIAISKYRRENKLHTIDINVYDFDGRPGIHLKSRSIYSIPANVANDVYDTAIQTYQNQSNAFSSDERVALEDVAKLSAAKEVTNELLVKRRVFLPRKYHLWLTVNNNE